MAILAHSGEIHALLAAYGYPIVFAVVAGESLGIPLPGETILTLAAIYAGTTGRLDIVGVIATAAAGAIIGDNIGYAIGHAGGYRLLRRYGGYVRIDEHRLKIGRYLFDRHGGKVVFFGRFVSVLRTYAAFLAGTMHMRWRRFLVFNAAGGITWTMIYGIGFFYFGTALKHLQTPFDIALGVTAVLVLAAGAVVLHRKSKQLGRAAEHAYPELDTTRGRATIEGSGKSRT